MRFIGPGERLAHVMIASGDEKGDEMVTSCQPEVRANGHPTWVNDVRT